MASQRRVQALIVLLSALAWSLDSQSWWLPVAFLACLILIAAISGRRVMRLDQALVLLLLSAFTIGSPALIEQVIKLRSYPSDPPSQVAETLQTRFAALERRLAAWCRTIASHPVVHRLLASTPEALPESEVRKRLFEILPQIEPPRELAHLKDVLGVSVIGSSHELLAWSGQIAESFEADLDRVGSHGASFFIEELSLAALKVLVPVLANGVPNGYVAVDLIIRKPDATRGSSEFPNLVDLLDPPGGYSVKFTPKGFNPRPERAPVGTEVSVNFVEGLSGEGIGYLTVQRSGPIPNPIAAAIAAGRDALWPAIAVLVVCGTAFTWGRGLGAVGFYESCLFVLFLGLSLFISLFSVPEIPPRAPQISPDRVFRGVLILAIVLWGFWITLRIGWRSRPSRGSIVARAVASAALLSLLLTSGMQGVVWFVENTSIAVWSVAGETEVIPRLLGHFTILTALIIGVFLVAALLPLRQTRVALVAPLAGAALALALGASPWSTVWLTLTAVCVSSNLTERVAQLRIRLLPGTLGGILLGFALVATYYPTVEAAAFQARQRVAHNLALQMVLQRLPSPGDYLGRVLANLLDAQPLCQDLARRDDELLSGLAAHYWVESALPRHRGDSALMVLSYDGTPVSRFSTAVQDYGRPEQEFLVDLLRSGQRTSSVVKLEGRSLQFLGEPVRCGGVRVGYMVLSAVTNDFPAFSSGLFDSSEVRVVELKNGVGLDPTDPRLLPPVQDGRREIGERLFQLHVIPVPGQDRFDSIAVLVRIPSQLRRLYALLWAGIGSAIYVVLGLVLAATAFRWIGPPVGPQMGLVLRFADKLLLGFLVISLIPVLLISPVYRRILEDRLEATIKDRGAVAAESAKTMILEKGTDIALDLADSLIEADGTLRSDLDRQLSRDPVISWALFGPELDLEDGAEFQSHPVPRPPESLLREAIALGQPLASFEDSQGQTVLQVIRPLYDRQPGEVQLVGILVLTQRLFTRDTDRILLNVKAIIGHEVELYSADGYLQASSRWPHLQIMSPSRRIHHEAFHYIGLLGAYRHTVIRKQQEQYRTFTTYRPCLDRRGRLTGFLAVSIGLSASEELANELRNMGLLVFLVGFAGLLLSTLVATLLVDRISKPLWDLLSGTSRVAQGDLEVQLQSHGDDEISQLVGSFNSMVGRLRDQRDELARSHRLAAWGEAARRVAHEIKNPLTPILLSTQHLRRVWAEQSPRFGQFFDRCTDTIIEQVKSLQHIATEFSDFARLPAPRLEPGDLNEAVERAVDVFQGTLPARVRLEVDLHKGSTKCEVDIEAISRSVVNLLQNAVHAVEEEGTVRVSTEAVEKADGRYVRLSVADNGVGIPDELRGRLFEPYFSTKSQGTGLGLAIAKRTFDEHRAVVHVESEPGQGTRFQVDFPALPEAT